MNLSLIGGHLGCWKNTNILFPKLKPEMPGTYLKRHQKFGIALPKSVDRYPANVLEKKTKKEAKRIVMGYIAGLAHIK